jgi:hypothetical protein
MDVPEKDAVVGAIDEQPAVRLKISTVIMIGLECRVNQRQFGISGSGVTV